MNKFPVHGLLPRIPTQAFSFAKKFNGENVVIAILDTGVDPGAAGMQVTSTGKPKIIDIVDCTGSGDVVLQPATVTDNTILGLSGKTLLLGNWKNPTGAYKVGLKSVLELFPADLITRYQQERKRKFDEKIHALKSKATEKKMLDLLKTLEKEAKDVGQHLDCVVWHDGENWRAVIDVEGSCDLSKYTPMTDYKLEHQYASFGPETELNYSINIYDNGEILNIVTNAGSHGTHVACIAAAHHPDSPEVDGVAPGAQIVSLKIGDHRLKSMETGSGLVRAALYLAKNKVDIANMSYGEAAAIPDYGRFIEILRDDAINKNNCVFVSSGGNAGPALSTVGAPGGTMDCVIGVGAYVDHDMMDAEYALLEKVTERPYTWSSRGPSVDGDVGVDVYAPGAAITSVPNYQLKKSQLMNGTSMSSPNACGCIALLLSGLKSEGIIYTPYQIKKAILNTSKDIQDPLKIGFLQIESAWEFLTTTAAGYNNHMLNYQISIGEKKARGIYLREQEETENLQEITIKVTPQFANDQNHLQNAKKIGLEIRVHLEATEEYIKIPEYLLLNSDGRSITVRVDPRNLTPGLHFGTINGYDADNRAVGPLFKIPITICKPVCSKSIFKLEKMKFSPGEISRKFINIPPNCNFAELIVSSSGRKTPARFMFHLLQLHPQTRYTIFEREFAFGLLANGIDSDTVRYQKSFPVLGGVTMELCMAQFWSTLDDSEIDVEFKFKSVMVSTCQKTQAQLGAASSGNFGLVVNSGLNGFTRMDISTPLCNLEIIPKVSFDSLQKYIRGEGEITPLKSRDILYNTNQIHQLILTYDFKLEESSSAFFSLKRFHNVLYDSNAENFAIYVFDKNKKSLLFQDVYGKAISLDEGDYVVKVQVQSADLEFLDQLKNSCLVVDIKLSTAIVAPISEYLGKLRISSKTEKFQMKKGDRRVLWIGDVEKLPKSAKFGDILNGKLELVDSVKDLFEVTYIVPPEIKSKDGPIGEKEPPKTDFDIYREALSDFEISYISKMKNDESKLSLIKDLEAKYNENFKFMKQKLIALQEIGAKELLHPIQSLQGAQERIVAANQAISLANESAVAMYFGVSHDLSANNEKDKNIQAEMKLRKEILCLAYQCYTEAIITAILYREKSLVDTDGFKSVDLDKLTVQQLIEQFNDSLLKWGQWISATPHEDGQFLLRYVWQQKRLGNHTSCLEKILNFVAVKKNIGDKAYKNLCEEKRAALIALGWDILVKYEDELKIASFPLTFAKF